MPAIQALNRLYMTVAPHCKVALFVVHPESWDLYCIQHVTDVAKCCNLLCHAHMVKIETMSAIQAHL